MIVVQALMFTMVVQGIGLAAQVDDWAKPFELLLVVGIALIIGVVAAWMSNYDLPHRWLRRIKLTGETSHSSEWYSAFTYNQGYVVLHLTGNRRLYGWPEEWPSDPANGHFRMVDVEWLRSEPTCVESQDVAKEMLIPVREVEMVEFMGTGKDD